MIYGSSSGGLIVEEEDDEDFEDFGENAVDPE
jgi:hypothetical protein